MQPLLLTKRLTLRPRTVADLEDCLAMDRDPLVTRYVPGPWQDPVAHRTFVLERMETRYPDELGYWTVTARAEPGLFLGWVFLIPTEGRAGEVEIGWRFPQRNWGNGYATEAARAVLDHGFAQTGVQTVIADIYSANGASLHVAEKLGMQNDGETCIDGHPGRMMRIERPAANGRNRGG